MKENRTGNRHCFLYIRRRIQMECNLLIEPQRENDKTVRTPSSISGIHIHSCYYLKMILFDLQDYEILLSDWPYIQVCYSHRCVGVCVCVDIYIDINA